MTSASTPLPAFSSEERRAAVAADYLVSYFLPEPDGRIVAVDPLLLGQARIIIGNEWGVIEAWDYDALVTALVQYAGWNPLEQPEPAGWVRHLPSGRRRPGGDLTREYIQKEE